jgi:hypothetical protein
LKIVEEKLMLLGFELEMETETELLWRWRRRRGRRRRRMESSTRMSQKRDAYIRPTLSRARART